MVRFQCKCLAVLFALALATPAFCAEWYQSYQKGEDAIKKGKCSDGVALMLQALKDHPNDDVRSRPYGTFIMEYVPHFYLFKCAVESGDFENAGKYMKLAESGGVYGSSKSAEYNELKNKYQKGTTKTDVTNVTVEPVKPQGQKVTPQNPNPLTGQQVTPPDNKQEKVDAALKEARVALAAKDLDAAQMAAYRARSISPGDPEAKRILDEVDRLQKIQKLDGEKHDRIEQAKRTLASGDLPSASRQIAELKDRYPADSQVIDLDDQLKKKKQADDQKQQEAKESKTKDQKQAERQVVVAFYKGQYDSAIELAKQALRKNPDSWRLHFYAGCSYASLAMMQSNSETNMRLAKASFQKARLINSSLTQPPYISPKIWNIFSTS